MKKVKIYLGAIDNQTPEQKELNYKQSEVVASVAPVNWPVKTPDQFIKYPIRSQDGSSRCVVFTYAKELSIWFQQKYSVWIDFSTCFPYQQRTDTSIGGCTSVDIFTVFPKIGNIFEEYMPGDGLGEQKCMEVKMPSYAKDLAKIINTKRISIPLDFDTVASTIQQTGKGVMLWFKFNDNEWKDIPIVSTQPTTSGHSITGIDIAVYNGQQVIVCDESWGLQYSMNGQRLITREYFNARCYQASYLLNFDMTAQKSLERPHFTGTIISAQECFKWEGLFPNNVATVENWGNITRTACISFQKRYNIIPTSGYFGELTKSKLKELYA